MKRKNVGKVLILVMILGMLWHRLKNVDRMEITTPFQLFYYTTLPRKKSREIFLFFTSFFNFSIFRLFLYLIEKIFRVP